MTSAGVGGADLLGADRFAGDEVAEASVKAPARAGRERGIGTAAASSWRAGVRAEAGWRLLVVAAVSFSSSASEPVPRGLASMLRPPPPGEPLASRALM